MKNRRIAKPGIAFGVAGIALLLSALRGDGSSRLQEQNLPALVPEMENWILTEEPQRFLPDNLFEYIDGAAESYLAYDFKELLVAQFEKRGTETAVTLEIYDMGNDTNAFGIYSTERFSESPLVDVGTQGYREGETLNFIIGENYVKLLCFNGGKETGFFLEEFAGKVADKVKNKGALPPVLSLFPKEALIANSEKYIRRNVMGFDFLSHGYLASYHLGGTDFKCFFIEAGPADDPSVLAERLLDFYEKDGSSIKSIPLGRRFRTKYGQNMDLGVSGSFLCGVIDLPDGLETTGEDYLGRLMNSVKAIGRDRNP